MPDLRISAPSEAFNAAVSALCFYGHRSDDSELSPEDFAIAMIKRWLGERLYDWEREQIEREAATLKEAKHAAISAIGETVAITVVPDEPV